MNEQEIMNAAKEVAEGMMQTSIAIYEEEYEPSKEVVVSPQAFVFKVDSSGNMEMTAFDSSIMYAAWSSVENRHRFSQGIAALLNLGAAFAIIISESRTARLDEHETMEEAIAAGKARDCLILALYLPGPRTLVGQTIVANGKAEQFAWLSFNNLVGGMVAGVEQALVN